MPCDFDIGSPTGNSLFCNYLGFVGDKLGDLLIWRSLRKSCRGGNLKKFAGKPRSRRDGEETVALDIGKVLTGFQTRNQAGNQTVSNDKLSFIGGGVYYFSMVQIPIIICMK